MFISTERAQDTTRFPAATRKTRGGGFQLSISLKLSHLTPPMPPSSTAAVHSPHLPTQLQGNADLWDWVASPGISGLEVNRGQCLEHPDSHGPPGSTKAKLAVMGLGLRFLSCLSHRGGIPRTAEPRLSVLSHFLVHFSPSPHLFPSLPLSLLKRQAAQRLPHTPSPHIRKGKEDAARQTP